jgi:hypothetical protein
VVLWAALIAIVWGLFAGAFATMLAWETARPLPTQAEATELFERVLGQNVVGQVGVDPALFVIYGQPLGRHNVHLLFSPDAGAYQQGSAAVSLNGPADVNYQSLVDSSRAWLRANGWRVSAVSVRDRVDCSDCDRSTLPKNAVFSARRGDDLLSLEVSLGDPGPLPLLRSQLNEPDSPWPPMWKWLGQPDLAVLFLLGTGAALLALAACALSHRPEPRFNATPTS